MAKISKKNQPEKRESLLKKATHQMGKGFYKPAASIFAKLLHDNPKDIDGLLGMAEIASLMANAQDIATCVQQVLEQEPNHLRALLYMGRYHELTQQGEIAVNIYQNLIMRDPDYWEAWEGLYYLCNRSNQTDAFNRFTQQVLNQSPNSAYALYYAASDCLDREEAALALELLKKALTFQPDSANIHYQLAGAYYGLNYLEEAATHYKKASELAPHIPGMKESYVVVLTKQRKIAQVKAMLPAMIRESEDPVRLLRVMSEVYTSVEEYEQALKIFEELYRRDPTEVHLISCIDAAVYAKNFEIAEKYVKLMLAKPLEQITPLEFTTAYNFARKQNNWTLSEKLLPTLKKTTYSDTEKRDISRKVDKLNVISDPGNSLSFIKFVHTEMAEIFRSHLPVDWRPNHEKAFMPTDRLRVGIVSGDFNAHVVSYFIEGWVKHYDRSRFALYCYANMHDSKRDHITEHYQALADKFVFVDKMSYRELAEHIQDDGVHILVDLTGYTAGSLVEAMVYKPAPVVMAWLGYPCTTGCSEFDYVIGDKWLYTPEHSELFVEKMLVLPESCYFVANYFETFSIDVPPMIENGYVTFGSMMNAYKINPDVARVWTEIIKRVPGSKLILNHPTIVGSARENIRKLFSEQDFPMEQLIIISEKHKTGLHVFYYQDFDVMLDTFPQTGGTTTLETFLMGVPVISLVGSSLLGRISYSFIQNCGISEPELMYAFTEEAYIEKAVALVSDTEKLTKLRLELANNVRSSNIFSPRKMTHQLEEGLIYAWNEMFSDLPVDRLLDKNRKATVNKHDGLKEISVTINEQKAKFLTVDNVNDIYHYVLQEQSGWFDPEYRFIFTLIDKNDQVLDCCDDCGLYTIPMLNQVGDSGKVYTCLMTEGQISIVHKATADCSNINLMRYDGGQDLFSGIDRLDFVRVSYEFSDDAGGLVAKNIESLAKLEPVIFFSARQDEGFNRALLSSLTGAGFSLYYYLPGIDALVPFVLDGEHDPYLINLIACKGKSETRLFSAGKLLRTGDIVVYQPDHAATAFMDWCHDQAYAKDFIEQWKEILNHPKDQMLTVYKDMLNAWALSQDKKQPLAKRYAALQAAVSVVGPLMNNMMSASLLWVAIRILSDAGARQPSVMMLMELQSRIEQKDKLSDLPFVPVDISWDNTPIKDRFEEWMLGATLETFEFRRVFSSYFTNKDQLESFRIISALGFNRTKAVTRLNLIKERFA